MLQNGLLRCIHQQRMPMFEDQLFHPAILADRDAKRHLSLNVS